MRYLDTVSKEEFIQMLKGKQGAMSIREFAASLKVSAAYLCDIYLGNRAPGKKIATAVGYQCSRTSVVTLKYSKLR